MSFKTTEDDLRQHFGQYGSVADVYVAMDKMTGRPRGFAFVTMGTAEEAKLAAEKTNGVDFGGRPLTVNEARPKEDSGGGGGGRGFGGGGDSGEGVGGDPAGGVGDPFVFDVVFEVGEDCRVTDAGGFADFFEG
ncbi:MAG TPA: RNA-binding protein [Opitutaceae bacterium]|nr:RNA-binding protein [Opitutaceae bacterium]